MASLKSHNEDPVVIGKLVDRKEGPGCVVNVAGLY
jgi:hypothetical protein